MLPPPARKESGMYPDTIDVIASFAEFNQRDTERASLCLSIALKCHLRKIGLKHDGSQLVDPQRKDCSEL